MMKLDLTKITKSKYIIPVLLAAVALLLLLPGSSDKTDTAESSSGQTNLSFDLESEEERLERTLSLISGAGKVSVLLSVSSGGKRVLAENGDDIAVISAGSGREQAVELYTLHAEYLGAVVVSQGAEKAEVRLALTKAVASFTGLGSDKITILDMEN